MENQPTIWAIILLALSALGMAIYALRLKSTNDQLIESLRKLTDYKIALDEHANVAITDPQGRIRSVNAKFCAISQYAREELVGQDHRLVNSGAHSKEFMRDLWTTISRGEIWKGEIKNRAKDGSYYWVNTTIVPFLDDRGKPRQYMAIHTDITERKRAELTTTRLAAVIESSDDAIVSMDLDGVIATWNIGAEKIYGYSAEEVIGTSIVRLIPAERREEELHILSLARRGGKLHHFETLRRTKAGQWIDVSVTASPLKDESGQVVGVSKVGRDITERKVTEKKLEELNETLELKVAERTKQLEVANKELESFSYSVSHDLRAPLRGIAGFTQILKDNYGSTLDEKAQEYLSRVLAATDRMGVLIDDMLALSRVTRNDFTPQQIDLRVLARGIVENLRHSSPDREVEIIISEGMTTQGDPRLLTILLENLLGNAWKFTSKVPHARIELSSETDGDDRIFCLRDNGAGFDLRYADKIFAPFHRLHTVTEFPGTGIGLAIVQRIVHRHGGRIWAEGEVGRGATFHFTIENTSIPHEHKNHSPS